jgi:DNA primase
MNIFTLVKDNISILDVMGDHVKGLFKSGNIWNTRCPFCSDNDMSMRINAHKGIFFCFNCNVTGDHIAFIEKINKCTAQEAVFYIIDKHRFSFHPRDLEKIEHKLTDSSMLKKLSHT